MSISVYSRTTLGKYLSSSRSRQLLSPCLAMAVLLGNLALLLDVFSPPSLVQDRKARPGALDLVLNLHKRDPYAYQASIAVKGLEPEGEGRSQRVIARGKSSSKANGEIDFESDEDTNGDDTDFEGDEFDWAKEMRRKVKEIEERKELERKAEELQNVAEEESDEGGEEAEEDKRMRVRKELEKVAKEQAERRATAQLMFELGQKAYGRGMYGRAIEFLEAALTIIASPTLFGGEIQIWLAMAYDAHNRHADCIALYRHLEEKHPWVSIRQQAAELRYILEAPKIKITQEEMVTIPLIGSSYDSYAATWSDKYKGEKRMWPTTNQSPSSRDYLGDFLVWRPPPLGLEKNQAFWIGLALWLSVVGSALFLQR